MIRTNLAGNPIIDGFELLCDYRDCKRTNPLMSASAEPQTKLIVLQDSIHCPRELAVITWRNEESAMPVGDHVRPSPRPRS